MFSFLKKFKEISDFYKLWLYKISIFFRLVAYGGNKHVIVFYLIFLIDISLKVTPKYFSKQQFSNLPRHPNQL